MAEAKAKSTGLAAFTRKPAGQSQAAQVTADTAQAGGDNERKRGKGATVALTVRLPRSEWERLHQFAVAEGSSIQALAVDGLNRLFAEKGLPRIKT